jgi:nucleoside-diphosphate-sugar epimerase
LKAFVTGGSGFVGRNLIAALRERGWEVRALARSAGSADTVRAAGAEPVSGDLESIAAMREGMAACEVVFHAAAHVEEWGPIDAFMRNTVQGTENVLAAAREVGVKTLVLVSTESVLLDGAPLVNVDETRSYPAKPLGNYALSKGLAEKLWLDADGEGLRTVAVRPRWIWGRGDTSLFPKFVQGVKDGRWWWLGDGKHKVSTTHIRNTVEGLILAAEKGRGGQAYFVTDGQTVEFRWFVEEMFKLYGVTPPPRTMPQGIACTLGEVCEFVWGSFKLKGAPPITRTAVSLLAHEATLNDAKARTELGYLPVVTLEEGLAEMRNKGVMLG